jgi:hypothetical protein
LYDYGDDLFFKDHDRRRERRRATRLRAWADPGGVAPVVDCVIHDLSEGGANVAAANGRALPDAFRLELDATMPLGEARVVWRNGAAAGVWLARVKQG